MYLIGLTGPIAAGKTTIAGYLKDKGAIVIDADRIGHDLLVEPEIKKKIKDEFGSHVFKDNSINRKKLAQEAFSSKKFLNALNKIMWPPIIKVINEELELYSRTLPANTIVVLDVPLLFESSLDQETEYIIAVITTEDRQIERLKAKGYSIDQAKDRIGMQTKQEELVEKSDHIVENNADYDYLEKEAEKLWHQIKKRHTS